MMQNSFDGKEDAFWIFFEFSNFLINNNKWKLIYLDQIENNIWCYND